MDSITDLPVTPQGHDSIWVVVDRLFKMVHLVPTTKTCTAEQLAKCHEREIVRLHGLPDNIVSDRDVRFVSRFWQTLHESFGPELFMSTKHHPQTDGQTETANGVLEDTLRHFASPFQKDLHPVFHVSALRHYHRNGPYQPRPFPDILEGVLEWEVDFISNTRYKGKRTHTSVHWAGYRAAFSANCEQVSSVLASSVCACQHASQGPDMSAAQLL